jgi:hypothetical protein
LGIWAGVDDIVPINGDITLSGVDEKEKFDR